MDKRYVDVEELENLFAQYSIPYTNIFDEMKQISAEEIAADLSVTQLREALDNKDEVFAIQLWQREDIYAALRAAEIPASSEAIDIIAADTKPVIENCSDNWDVIRASIKRCLAGRKEV